MICEYCNKTHDGSYGSGRFCNEKCARGYSTRSKRKEINKKVSKVLTKSPIFKICKCGKLFSSSRKYCSNSCLRKYWEISERGRKILSLIAKKRNLGGHTSKEIMFYIKKNGETVYLHSSYEVKVVASLDYNKIKWIRPKFLVWEDEERKIHRYYPDFYLPDYEVYLDPKNDYLIEKDREKIQKVSAQNKIKIFVLSKNELEWEEISKLIGV